MKQINLDIITGPNYDGLEPTPLGALKAILA